MKQKFKILLLCSFFIFGCSTKKSEEAVPATACSFDAVSVTKTVTYGAHDPSSIDRCEQFNGTTSHWTGMSISSTALVGVPTALYDSGLACGACVRIQGVSATVIGRVIDECPGCTNDTIDIDEPSYLLVTGFPNSGSGPGDVTVTAIPCPITGNAGVFMNTGTNPFYLNIVPYNHVTPIKSVEVDFGSGFQSVPRVGTTGAFAIAPGFMVSATATVKLTDSFDQTATGSFDTAVSSTTDIGAQFGTCP